MVSHDEENRKMAVMYFGPSCPLHLGTLDSPDYWTDDALMAAVRPLSAAELHRMVLGSRKQNNRQRSYNSSGRQL